MTPAIAQALFHSNIWRARDLHVEVIVHQSHLIELTQKGINSMKAPANPSKLLPESRHFDSENCENADSKNEDSLVFPKFW